MYIEDSMAPTYPTRVANAVVSRIKCQVDNMIGKSSLVQGRWDEKDKTSGIFERNEIRIGKLLGSGGFADVYEIIGFELEEDAMSKYDDSQIAARKYYYEHAIHDGNAKYVMKRLKLTTMQDPNKFCLAASDLTVEAQFLNSLDHDNILKLRGWATDGVNAYASGSHEGYFLILDRLTETLEDRIVKWRQEKNSSSIEESFQQLGLNNDNTPVLLSRTKIAHQIASALKYLHNKNMVFRDLKPNNVGFDNHGTVKIFDFGLSRELPNPCAEVDDVFLMSGAIGTVRYMAPEVALSNRYNQKVDTYSWAILYWSCITLEKPYDGMSRPTHKENVCLQGQRPALSHEIPKNIRNLLEQSWLHSVFRRYTMPQVCTSLELIEKELASSLATTRSNTTRVLSTPAFRRNKSNTVISIAA